MQNARLFALLNLAQADAYFAIWDAKYTYNFWRPVTAIRAADTDGNPDTAPDPAWTSFLGTPAFPSYVSGHSGHSAAAAAVLAAYFETDDVPFTLSTDSLPGVTRSLRQLLRGGAGGERQPRLRRHPLALRRHGRGGPRVRGRQLRRHQLAAASSLARRRRPGRFGRPGPPSPRRLRSHSDIRAGVITVFVPPAAPAHTPDTPLLGALPDEAAAPVLQSGPAAPGPGRFPAVSPMT